MNKFQPVLEIMNPKLVPGKIVLVGIKSLGGNYYHDKIGLITQRSDNKVKVAYCWSESEENLVHHEISVDDLKEGYYTLGLLKVEKDEQ